ncbi:recombinase family protein [Streptomyces sp. TRM66268-LWL]|uniref:Recombinase family protein n=1 Tax=Streptomyces polyasparticus TaxID=2767826 RepID=A0ABR7SUB9_9ACTN|nr:recombinase family protein [Streptomyces polyasparticus]MBC9718998.1 recombinase family protein [Streptomyces polyasparticus]
MLENPYDGMRLIPYGRVSQLHEDSESDADQFDKMAAFAERHNVTLVGKYEPDLDMSGTEFSKRKVRKYISAVADGEADGILVMRLSRWGRNDTENRVYEKELSSAGGILVSVMESEDPNTRAGRLRRKMAYLLDSEESETRGDYWRDTHEKRRANGRPHNGSARFGYMRCPECIVVEETLKNGSVHRRYAKCKACKGILVVDPARGPYAAEFMKRWVNGEGASALALEMYERGVRSLAGKKMGVSQWFAALDSGFIAGLLRGRTLPLKHPLYKKRYPSNRPEHYDRWQKGEHAALVSLELWEAYKRKRRSQSPEKASRSDKGKYSVSGLLWCASNDKSGGPCGGKYKAGTTYSDSTRTEKVKMFNCRHALDAPKTCAGAQVRLTSVESAVLQWLEEQRTGETAALAEEAATEVRDTAEARLKELRPRLEKAQAKLDNLLDLKLEGEIDGATYERKQKELVAQRDMYAAQIADAEDRHRSASTPHMEAIGNLVDRWHDPKMKVSVKQASLRSVIREIRIHRTPRGYPSRIEIVPSWPHQPAESQEA